MTKVIYQYQNNNMPIFDVQEFVKLIESHDPKLEGFFDVLYEAMNPKNKNQKTQSLLKQKVMLLCYQMAALRNKQVSGTKTSIGLFLAESGTSTSGINTLANIGISATYQTVYNKLEKFVETHEETVRGYVKKSVCLIKKFLHCLNL